MAKPIHIFIGGQELLGYTELSLERSKDNMTGQAEISVFFGYVPGGPVLSQVVRAQDIMIYVGGHLAFFGKVDKRKGTGAKQGNDGTSGNPHHDAKGRFTSAAGDTGGKGGAVSYNIGPNEYTVRISARGQTKYLIDSSHQLGKKYNHIGDPTTRTLIEELIEPWGIEVEWMGTEIKIDKRRFRDGARVVDEIQRIATENAYFIYETADGKLRVTDDTARTSGEALVLGDNILSFSAEQSEETANSKITVKGQRTKKDIRGQEAVLNTFKTVEDKWVKSNIPLVIQHYGDATDEALERRAKFEADKRSSASKTISLEVFHVQARDGSPWDIGQLHYVEIPPEGIYDIFECTGVSYKVQSDKTLSTTLTLSPPPSQGAGASGIGGFLSALPAILPAYVNPGTGRRAAAGNGEFPDPWTSPDLTVLPVVEEVASLFTGVLQTLTVAKEPPLKKLPANFESGQDNGDPYGAQGTRR